MPRPKHKHKDEKILPPAGTKHSLAMKGASRRQTLAAMEANNAATATAMEANNAKVLKPTTTLP
jgi:hypothetical protein